MSRFTFVGWSYFWGILMHVIIAEAQDVQFDVNAVVLTYTNPSNRDALNNCCTGRGRDCDNLPCNNLFRFCAGPRGQTSLANDQCPFGRYNFTINDDDITTVEVPNPIVFRGRERIPVEFQFFIEIDNVRNDGTRQLVDRFDLVGPLPPPNINTNTQTFNGAFMKADITMSFRATCSQNYFGADCNTHCVPTEQFTCDPINGSIICREGYQSEATNCSACVPATGCNTTNAYCTTPEECICLPGFTGTLCNTAGLGGRVGLSQGGVAGVVIVVLILLGLSITAVVLGILFWVYQPWSNGWFGLEMKLARKKGPEDAIENPVYEDNEAETSRNHVPPVQVMRYTSIATEATVNGQVHAAAPTVDDDNPLYASSALEKILNTGESGNEAKSKKVVPRKPSPPKAVVANGHAQSNGRIVKQHKNPKAIGTLRESSSLEHVLMTATVTSPKEVQPPGLSLHLTPPNEEESNKRNSLPNDGTPTSGPKLLMASQSVDNLLRPNAASLNPYGEYSDQTLQRAISGNSFSAEGDGEEDGASERVFDNPDYEFVDVNNSIKSDKPIDDDYEQI